MRRLIRAGQAGQYTSAPGKAIPAVERRRTPRGAPAPDWLVVSAWAPELSHLRRGLPSLAPALRRRVATGTLGVGLVEASVGATLLLARLRPAAVILVGSAGLYPAATQALRIGDAVAVGDIALLAEALPGDHVYLPEIVPSRVRTSRTLTSAVRKAAALPLASVACPLAITRSRAAAAFVAKQSGCDLENLEAFALARAAAALAIPVAVVVGIANRVGPAAHREWMQNGAAATAAACQAVLAFLETQSG